MRVLIPANYSEERRYILDVLLGEFLGLDYGVEIHDQRDYHLLLRNGKTLIIEDHLFSTTSDYLNVKYIPEKIDKVWSPFSFETDVPILYGRDLWQVEEGSIRCGLDLFASAFFMLTRWEEYVKPARDPHNRFCAASSVAYQCQFLHRPVVNEYVEMLWNMLKHLGIEQPRSKKRFSWTLTHDVDYPFRWDVVKNFQGDCLQQFGIWDNVSSFFLTKIAGRKDPFDTFDFLMDQSERVGSRSHFYFMADGKTHFDPGYQLPSRRVNELMEKIHRRAHHIGFHPSHDTYNNPTLWGEEYRKLANYSPQQVTTGRQHHLRFEVPTTWQIWEDHNMWFDSSVGYHDQMGFRCGSCYDFPVFNILSRKKLKLREKPPVVVDCTLLCEAKLTPEMMTQRVLSLLQTVRKYRGNFVLLWHNSSFNTPFWRPYEKIYQKIIETLHEAWVESDVYIQKGEAATLAETLTR